jgi:hypothetical protein
MTFAGEVVSYVDPPPRSKWAEPEDIVLDQDDLAAVAEAGAEVAATDLDAELAELVPDAGGHLFSQFVNRASMKMLTDLSPSERLVFVGHALAMGPANSHHWSIESVGAIVGVTRSPATKATAKLVELGVLHKKDRGRIEAVKSRPAEYRLTERMKLTTTRVSNEHTGDSGQTECPTCVSNEHTGDSGQTECPELRPVS